MHHSRQSDDCGHEEDRCEEEQRVGDVELRGVPVRGSIVCHAVLDAVPRVQDRCSEHEDGRSDHEHAEADPLGIGVPVVFG